MNVGERHLAREAYRRFASPPPVNTAAGRVSDMLATRFGKQIDFIRHPSRRKAALCTRRAGKTEMVPAYALQEAAKHADSIIIYCAPTLKRARALMWKPLKDFNKRFNFGGKVNESLLTISLDNGSAIRLDGADKVMDADKKRGDKVRLVLIDEASVYRPEVLELLIEDVFGPSLEDLQGTICLLGTPGVVCAGIWYEISRHEPEKRRPGWTLFQWSVLDNPHMAHMVERLPELKRERGWTDDSPTYLREWCGRWVNDTGALFYRYDERRNGYGALPAGHAWRYVVGVDLGFDDAFAYVVWAFAPTSRQLFEVESYKKSGLIPSQWAAKLEDVNERYHPQRMVVDSGGLGKAVVEEMRQRHALPVQPAEKQNKLAYVEMLNGELTAGVIQVRADSHLALEWKVLPKDPEDPTKEDPRFDNHCSDGGLYGFREARHWLGVIPEELPAPGTPEHAQREAERLEAAEEARLVSIRDAQSDEHFNFGNDDSESLDFGGDDDGW